MRGVIVGGGTFLGYWMKKRVIAAGLPRPIIIDLSRMNTHVYISNSDIFYRLQEIDYLAIEKYRPNYFFI
jgi:hypothetical protein